MYTSLLITMLCLRRQRSQLHTQEDGMFSIATLRVVQNTLPLEVCMQVQGVHCYGFARVDIQKKLHNHDYC